MSWKKIMDGDDIREIGRQADQAGRCLIHNIQYAPVFDADWRVVDWECWACRAGVPTDPGQWKAWAKANAENNP